MVSKEPRKIRSMFGAIAHRYDLLNHALSMGIDLYWRWRVARRLRPFLNQHAPALDLCTGTADLALQLSRYSRVVGCDFTHAMLVLGRQKVRGKSLDSRIRFVEGDALSLPFADGIFSAVTIAFGLRNLASYRQGLQEMHRVLRPGGVLAVLEFSQPRIPVLKQAYVLYCKHVVTRLGAWISGDAVAYSYLPASVNEFLTAQALSRLIGECGFGALKSVPLTGGIAVLQLGRKEGKPAQASPQC